MPRDQALAADVEKELRWDPRVDPDHIGVAVDDGAVTMDDGTIHLHGHVHSFFEKQAAREAAAAAPGVSMVDNRITVLP
jgi:osmotically-inducible protein OsmY